MSDESGFTLIEVVIALLILSVVMLGLAATTGTLLLEAAENEKRATAVELVHDRLQTILISRDYGNLAAEYAGTETNLPGQPDLKRITTINPVTVEGAGNIGAKKATVKVVGPGIGEPVEGSVVVGAQ